MQKQYIARLSADKHHHLQSVVKKLSDSIQNLRSTHFLLKADAEGPNWTGRQIAKAFDCRIKTKENIRRRLVEQSFEALSTG